MQLPDWPDIFWEDVTHDDERDLSLTFSASEEFKICRGPLYQYDAVGAYEGWLKRKPQAA